MTYLSTERMAGVPTCAGLGSTRGDYIGRLGAGLTDMLQTLKSKTVAYAGKHLSDAQGWKQIDTQGDWIIEQGPVTGRELPPLRGRASWGEFTPSFTQRSDLVKHIETRTAARKALQAAIPAATPSAPAATPSAPASTPVPSGGGSTGTPEAGAVGPSIPTWAWATAGVAGIGLLFLLFRR